MGDTFLDKGQMITGKFGRRYMVRELLESRGRIETYEIAESGKIFMAVAVSIESARYRSEFVEPLIEKQCMDSEFVWPVDVFSFEKAYKKYTGYIVKPINTKGFRPFSSVANLSMNDKKKVCYGIAKAFSQLHIKGFVYNEVPSAWIDEKMNVCLVGLPVKENSRFSSNDNLAVKGFSSPEFFTPGQAKQADIYTDRFLLASFFFYMLIGLKPFVGSPTNPGSSYARFAFSKEVEDPIDDYGWDKVNAWNQLSDLHRAMFIKSFSAGVNNPLARFSEEDWARSFQNFV